MNAPARILLTLAAAILFIVNGLGATARVNSDLVLEIDGKRLFPIGFTMPPPPGARTPAGSNAFAELSDAGANFMRTGAMGGPWDEACIRREEAWLEAAREHNLFCMPYLRELAVTTNDAQDAALRKVVERFRNHPALGAWKGDDEPEWAKRPVAAVERAYRVIKQADPDRPVVIIHAPRGTTESLRSYSASADVLGADIYPVGYPPGGHSLLTNKTLSLVGDHTRAVMEVAEGNKPVWMVLQIAWSGVVKPGKTLRFPTFAEERFMTYQAIINGARGLIYFGGSLTNAMNSRDAALGWNWTFWQRVLRPVIEEIGTHSPLYPALIAPNSALKLQVKGSGIEWLAREADGNLFVMACKSSGKTEEVEFAGLPPGISTGEILYEAPKKVAVRAGAFKDWFGPFEVHVYLFKLK